MSNIAYLALQGSGSEASGTKWNNILNDTTSRDLTDDAGGVLSWTAQYVVAPAGAYEGNTDNTVGTGDASWVDEAIVKYSGHYVQDSWATLRVDVGSGEEGLDYKVVMFPSHGYARTLEMRVNGGTSQVHEDVDYNESIVYTFTAQPDSSGYLDLEFQKNIPGGAAYLRAAYIEKIIPEPAATLDDSAFEPGKAITGTYADYASAPTVVTLTDSEANAISSASEITDLVIDDGAGTYAFTMPDRITTGTGTTLLRGDITVELT